jgi:hypothetical protein
VLFLCCYNLHRDLASFIYTHDSFADRLPFDQESFADIYLDPDNAYAEKNSLVQAFESVAL